MAYLDQQGSGRAVSVGIVVVVHALIGYAFVTGLTPGWVDKYLPKPPITVFVPTPPEALPPDPAETKKPTIAPATAPVPEIRAPRVEGIPVPVTPTDPVPPKQGPFGSIDFTPAPPPLPKVIPVPLEPVAKAVEPPRVVQGAAIRSYGFGNADYPNEALRAEESGTTRVRVTVSASGRASDCKVTGSSGSYSLDQAACRLVKSRSRFAPAKDSAGKAVEQSIVLPITWRLPPH